MLASAIALLILSFGVLITQGIKKIRSVYGEIISHRVGIALMIGIIAIFSINQISMSQRQIIESSIEINHMRAAYHEVIESGEFWNLKEVHVTRPKLDRSYNGHLNDREFLPATMANPGHILQITRAVLREILPLDQLFKVNLVDCGFDRKCTQTAPKNALIISQSKFGTPLPELHPNHVILIFPNSIKNHNLLKPICLLIFLPLPSTKTILPPIS